MFKVRLSPSARRDLRDIAEYLREQAGVTIAKKYSALLRQKLQTLSRDALRYRERRALGTGRRALLFGPYIAFYRVNREEGVVEIQRVVHGSRNITTDLFDD